MSSMFHTCYQLQEIPPNMMDYPNNAYLPYMFYNANNIKYLPPFPNRSVVQYTGIFQGCSQLKTIPFINTSSSTANDYMFWDCNAIQEIPYLLDMRKNTNFAGIFGGCYNLRTTPNVIGGASASNFSSMFQNCRNLSSFPPASNLDFSNGTNFSLTFYGISTDRIPQYNYAKAQTMTQMFRYSQIQYLPDFNTTTALTNTTYMLSNCPALRYCPGITMSAVTDVSYMFENNYALQYVPQLNWSSVTTATSTFINCNSLAYIGITGMAASFSVANCSLGATALNQLYSSLATVGVSGAGTRTLTVTGNYGSSRGDDKTIAIGKGWAVTA
jgi:hypothetical protein